MKIEYQSGPDSLSMVSIETRVSPEPASAQADNSVAVRSVTGPRTDWRKILPRGGIVFLLERAHADDETGDAVGAVDLQQPVGKLAGLIDVAAGEHGEKGAAEQIGIFRIGLEHVEVIGRGCGGIALGAGMAGRQIIAGRIVVQEFLLGGRGVCRRQDGEYGGANNSGAPGQQRVNHDSSIGKLARRTGNQAP